MRPVRFAWVVLWLLGQSLSAQPVTAKMEQYLHAASAASMLNGTVLVAQKGKLLLQQGYGWKNAEKKWPNDKNTIFQIGSVTKQFTATTILYLQEKGKLSLQDKLSKYYPAYPNADKITIEHLLSHTSGIYNYTSDRAFMENGSHQPANEEKILALFENKPLNFEPGTRWSYSNSGYCLLGYIIQKTTGHSYESAVRSIIFQPLRMLHSGFDFAHLPSADRATGYKMISKDSSRPSMLVDSSVSFSAGAMYSTVGDLYAWDQSLSTTTILTRDALQNAFTVRKNNYGLGWGIDTIYGKRFIAHSGGIDGFLSYNAWVPDDSTAIIVLANAESSQPGKIARDLYAILENQPYTIPIVRKEIKLDTGLLRQYVGEYELRPGFKLTISLEEGILKGQATGQPKIELYAERENYFFLKLADAQIEFVTGADGKVEKLILYQNGQVMPGKKIK